MPSFKQELLKAKSGDKEAQYQIGTAFENGTGVEKDYQEALKWYSLSAKQGLSKAWIHLTGSGTPTAEDSLNNSSVTDGGTGLYTFNFPSVFGNIHYCAASMAGNAGATTDARHQIPNAELTPSAFQVRNVYGTNSVSDEANLFIIFHGELGET